MLFRSPRPLLDRMELIELSSYTDEEKLEIAKRHLLPKQRKKHGLSGNQLRMSDDCIRELDAYVWDLNGGAKDRVKKEHDHAMDDMRYFVSTVLGKKNAGFSAHAVTRKRGKEREV